MVAVHCLDYKQDAAIKSWNGSLDEINILATAAMWYYHLTAKCTFPHKIKFSCYSNFYENGSQHFHKEYCLTLKKCVNKEKG